MAGTEYKLSEGGCPICGKNWCFHWPDSKTGSIITGCHRTDAKPGDIVEGLNGKEFKCIFTTKGEHIPCFKSVEDVERERQEWLAENGYTSSGKKGKAHSVKRANVTYKPAEPQQVLDVAKLASPEKLDRWYRALLKKFPLSKKHEKKLKLEWDRDIQGVNIYALAVKSYLLGSLPPEDWLRYDSKEPWGCPSRKQVIAELIKELGETPEGVPGFYQKPDGTWVFSPQSGILYPVLDYYRRNKDGQPMIIGLRLGDDKPVCVGRYNGMDGKFVYTRTRDAGTAGWYFEKYLEGGKTDWGSRILVWRYGAADNKIELSPKGYPAGAKVDGKYKNVASYREKTEERDGKTVMVNTMTNGCQLGSLISLYTKPGDLTGIVYITEGEKKSIILNLLLNAPVICLPGVSTWRKVFEPERGADISVYDEMVKRSGNSLLAVLAFDADKETKAEVMNQLNNAAAEFKRRGLPVGILDWKAEWGKGIDDALLDGIGGEVNVLR